jgi:hypothetical protein
MPATGNPWLRGRLPFPPRYALGLWLNQRKLVSGAFAIDQEARLPLIGKRPFWRVFNFALTSQQSLEDRVGIPNDFWLCQLMGSGSAVVANTGSFRAQLLDAGFKNDPRKLKGKLSARPLNANNFVGTAGQPQWLHEPYFIPAGALLVCRAQNLAVAANNVQIVAWGYSDDV